MSLAVLKSRALAGMHAPQVTVEVHLANGLPSFTIVGLPETEVKESKDRVRAALQNARFEFPAKRITVNLAPADLPKESGHRLVHGQENRGVSCNYGQATFS
jgi:magnesium chelatase family protein